MQIIPVENLQTELDNVISTLNAGGIIVFPTETCYGVGVDATNAAAVTKLLKYKNRPAGKAISVAVATAGAALELIEANSQNRNVIKKFLPGPITVVGKSLGKIDRRLESELGTLGIRIPAYPALLTLLEKFAKPLTSTSANLAGEATPYNAQKLLEKLPASKRELIDIVIDAAELEHNPPSLVIDTTGTNQVYRPGLITPEDLEHGETFLSQSVDETKTIAANFIKRRFISSNSPTLLVLLEGELGAGKTQFAAGMGAALGIKQVINSPSFTLAKEYSFTLPSGDNGYFHHLDLWRSQHQVELSDLGVEFAGGQVQLVAIEWPDKLVDLPEVASCRIKILKLDKQQRRIIITPFNP